MHSFTKTLLVVIATGLHQCVWLIYAGYSKNSLTDSTICTPALALVIWCSNEIKETAFIFVLLYILDKTICRGIYFLRFCGASVVLILSESVGGHALKLKAKDKNK